MIRVPLVVVLAFFCGLSGCIVEVTQPVGAKVEKKTLKRYEGSWLVKGEDQSATFRINKSGELKSASVGWSEDNDQFEIEEYLLDLRKVGNHLYVFSHQDGVLSFMKWSDQDRDTIQLTLPSAAKLREAAKAGLVDASNEDVSKNKSKDSSIRIVGNEKLEKLLAADDVQAYFDKDATITLQRIKNSQAK